MSTSEGKESATDFVAINMVDSPRLNPDDSIDTSSSTSRTGGRLQSHLEKVDVAVHHMTTFSDWLFDNCAEPFIPFRKKDISAEGRRNMGYYGFIVLAFIAVSTGMSTMALIESGVTEPYVLLILALPFIISVLGFTKFVASIMNSCLKKFQ